MGGMLLRLTDKLLRNTRGLFLYTTVLFLPGFDNDHGQQYCDVALCSLAGQLIFLNSLLLDIQSNFSGWDTEIQSLSLQGATNIPPQWDPPPPLLCRWSCTFARVKKSYFIRASGEVRQTITDGGVPFSASVRRCECVLRAQFSSACRLGTATPPRPNAVLRGKSSENENVRLYLTLNPFISRRARELCRTSAR